MRKTNATTMPTTITINGVAVNIAGLSEAQIAAVVTALAQAKPAAPAPAPAQKPKASRAAKPKASKAKFPKLQPDTAGRYVVPFAVIDAGTVELRAGLHPTVFAIIRARLEALGFKYSKDYRFSGSNAKVALAKLNATVTTEQVETAKAEYFAKKAR